MQLVSRHGGFLILSLPAVILTMGFGTTTGGGEGALTFYDLQNEKPAIIEVTGGLREISGIVKADGERVFAHNDEEGTVFEIDLSTGKTKKRFSLGKKTVRDDFEDIAIVKERFYLVASNGTLYKFREGEDRDHVTYSTYKTGLTAEHNIEGLCYDPETKSLLLACKGFPGRKYSGSRTVYTFSLETMKLRSAPRFVISRKKLKEKYRLSDFKPSGLARNPLTGTFFILSSHRDSHGPAVVEVSSQGVVLGCTLLPASVHHQPEGIAFGDDGTLFISDEGNRKGTITRYAMKEQKK